MKAAEIANNTFQLVKIKTNYTNKFIINNIKKLNVIDNNKIENYSKSDYFKILVKLENRIRMQMHPSFIKKISETNDIIRCCWVNITHSSKDIKINRQNITKTKISSYIKDGKQQTQYLVDASCEIEVTKEEYNEMIQDISTNPDEINKLGGLENIKKITEKLENEWHNKPSYDYINYF